MCQTYKGIKQNVQTNVASRRYLIRFYFFAAKQMDKIEAQKLVNDVKAIRKAIEDNETGLSNPSVNIGDLELVYISTAT